MYIFYFYFVLSWFSLKHMIGYPQSQLQWEIVHIAAYLTQEIKYTVDNSLSIGEAG